MNIKTSIFNLSFLCCLCVDLNGRKSSRVLYKYLGVHNTFVGHIVSEICNQKASLVDEFVTLSGTGKYKKIYTSLYIPSYLGEIQHVVDNKLQCPDLTDAIDNSNMLKQR